MHCVEVNTGSTAPVGEEVRGMETLAISILSFVALGLIGYLLYTTRTRSIDTELAERLERYCKK